MLRGAAGRGRPRADHRRRRDRALPRSRPPSDGGIQDAVVDALVDALSDHRSAERVAVGGAANLARFGDSFEISVRPLLEALEEHVVLLKLLGEAQTGGMVTVRIGHEGPYQEFASDQRRLHRLRPGRRGGRQPRRGRPHPHGLPGNDGSGARGRPLRLPHPRRGLGASRQMTPDPDLYSAARRRSRRRRRRDQEGLPPARPAAAPRRQPRPGDAGAVQGGLARLRVLSDPQKRAVYDRGGDVFGGARRLRCRLLLHRHHGRVLRRPGARHARAADPARGSTAARTRSSGWRSPWRRRRSASPASSRSTPPSSVRPASGEGTAPGTHPVPCETCRGTGEVAHVQRSFLGEIRTLRPCSACRGYGTLIPDPCRECSGDGRVRARRSITVKIPAGVDTGTRVQLAGQGEVGAGGGPAGDLYVEVHVAPHEVFTRDGTTLHCTVAGPDDRCRARHDADPADARGRHRVRRRQRGRDVVRARREGRHPVRQRAHLPRSRRAGAAGRARRPRRDGRGRDPVAARPRQEELLRELAAIRGEEKPDGRLGGPQHVPPSSDASATRSTVRRPGTERCRCRSTGSSRWPAYARATW